MQTAAHGAGARGHHGGGGGCGVPDRLRTAGQGGAADRHGRAADPDRRRRPAPGCAIDPGSVRPSLSRAAGSTAARLRRAVGLSSFAEHLGFSVWLLWSRVAVSRALRYMDNIRDAESDSAAQAAAVRRPQTWILSMLYIGTFGSFLGCAAAFPLPIKTQFPQVHGADFAWMARCSTRWPAPGRLGGRPVGGRAAGRSERGGPPAAARCATRRPGSDRAR